MLCWLHYFFSNSTSNNFQLLSTYIQQNGKDDEGILGFLPTDIKRELKRASESVRFEKRNRLC